MLDRKKQPAFQKSNSFTLIQPQKITLPNGLMLTLVNGGEQEVIKIEFIFKAGKWYEQHPGVAYFSANLLQKGTAKKTSYEISAALDQQGVSLEVTPGFDFTSVAVYGLTKNISKLFELISEIITQPVFPELELQQAKDIYIQGLKINLEKTSYLASRQLRQNLFGKDHPYGHDAEIEDVQKLEASELRNFHDQHFKNFEVISSGKISPTILDALSEILSTIKLANGPKKTVLKKDVAPFSEFLEKESSVQTSIRLGKKIIPRTHADYPAMLLFNHIFGGYFGSRLMKNIREEKGLTYGIYSSITALKHESYLSIGADVNKENRDVAIQEIKNEMRQLREKMISESELEIARNHFIGSLQSELATPFAHADKIKNITLFSLPEDYYQALIYKVETLSQQDLQGIANAYFETESFSIVTVG